MRYKRITTETIKVVCVYDPLKPIRQHPHIYAVHGKRYLATTSQKATPLHKGDWIANKLTRHGYREIIIPVAEQDAWEEAKG